MKTPGEICVMLGMPAGITQVDIVKQIQLDAWRQGMKDAARIVHDRGIRLAENNCRDTIREIYAENDILAARDAKGEK